MCALDVWWGLKGGGALVFGLFTRVGLSTSLGHITGWGCVAVWRRLGLRLTVLLVLVVNKVHWRTECQAHANNPEKGRGSFQCSVLCLHKPGGGGAYDLLKGIYWVNTEPGGCRLQES